MSLVNPPTTTMPNIEAEIPKSHNPTTLSLPFNTYNSFVLLKIIGLNGSASSLIDLGAAFRGINPGSTLDFFENVLIKVLSINGLK